MWSLREDFDPDYTFDTPEEIRVALTTIHGPHAAAEIAAYFDAEAASTAAAQAEDIAWTEFSAMPLRTAPELAAWLDYVVEHAAKEDEAVTLQRALRHLAGLLSERLGF
jgi:hypothetical protein